MTAGPSLHIARDDTGVDVEAAERAAADFLVALGIDVDREDLRETPGRMARAYAELFDARPLRLTTFANDEGYDELVLARGIPFGAIYSISPGDINVGQRASDGFPPEPTIDFAAAKNPSGAVLGVFPHFRPSYVQQFNLTIEHEITPWQLLLKAGYVGNLGRRLDTTLNLNQPIPGPTSTASRRPYFGVRPSLSDVTYAVSDGLSNYNAAQLTVEKRLSHGLGLLLG